MTQDPTIATIVEATEILRSHGAEQAAAALEDHLRSGRPMVNAHARRSYSLRRRNRYLSAAAEEIARTRAVTGRWAVAEALAGELQRFQRRKRAPRNALERALAEAFRCGVSVPTSVPHLFELLGS